MGVSEEGEEVSDKTNYPMKCPITGYPFFMLIEHPDLGEVPTYGGPFDSYTIPTSDEDGNYYRERYDHDAGGWVEGCEFIELRRAKA